MQAVIPKIARAASARRPPDRNAVIAATARWPLNAESTSAASKEGLGSRGGRWCLIGGRRSRRPRSRHCGRLVLGFGTILTAPDTPLVGAVHPRSGEGLPIDVGGARRVAGDVSEGPICHNHGP